MFWSRESAHPRAGEQARRHLRAILGTTALSAAAIVTGGLAGTAQAQQAAQAPAIEQITVTGTRIVREGYEAPTPLTVISTEDLQRNASANLTDYLNTLPALAGNRLSSAGQVNTTTASAGAQTINLRSLGGNRTLVLLNGQRVVGIDYDGAVHTGTFPDQLIERVDVVTGGASAVYGSDAVAGVVNFILDTDYTGVKGDISTGITNYGDDFNYKAELSAGFPFAGGRGHVLLSGSHLYKAGIEGDGGRSWNYSGEMSYNNPAYTATNGLPRLLRLPRTSLSTASHGGIITAGPLKGIAFGEGGTPYRFNYGEIVSPPYMTGGDWAENQIRNHYWLDARQKDYKMFARVGYDVTDNVNVWVQYDWAQASSINDITEYWFFGGATSPQIRIDNAYLPASVRAQMVANNLTSLQLGTLNADVGRFGPNNEWISNRVYAGLEGTFDIANSPWSWELTYGYGSTDQAAHSDLHKEGVPLGYGMVTSKYMQSIDAVFSPTGEIVCRVALTNPGTDCKPWNVMGVNVNSGRIPSFISPNFQYGLIEQTTFTGSLTGEPFSVPAGPVSLALSAAWRENKVASTVDIDAINNDRPVGRHSSLNGQSSVKEGALETVIPLAKGEDWAQAWDLSAAVRFTDYELSGFVTTWKLGTTFELNDDIRFRVTRSRDIREPTLQELFAVANISGAGVVTDRFRNDTIYPILGTGQGSNPALVPERADTWGLGVVLSPAFLDGFTASVDFWDVNIKDALFAISAQQVIDLCYEGYQPACTGVIRNAGGTVDYLIGFPVNLASQNTRGLDIESSYTTRLEDWVSDWGGQFRLHGLATIYLRNMQDNSFDPPINRLGENAPSYPNTSPPNWKLTVSATYSVEDWSATLTGRAISSGKLSAAYVECTTGCPPIGGGISTINNNHIPGAYYLDANVGYNLTLGETTGQIYLSAKNILNRDPPWTGGGFLQSITGSGSYYDTFGVVYRAGVRFSM